MTAVPATSADCAGSKHGHVAWVGLGANLGDPVAALNDAFAALQSLPRTRLAARSSLYRTAPVDATGPDYVNAVARLDTDLDADELLARLQDIELRAGRTRPYRNAPRLLDLDLLLYDDLHRDTAALQLPHPRMHQRAFVLAPLAELSPHQRVGDHGEAATLLAALQSGSGAAQPIERLATR